MIRYHSNQIVNKGKKGKFTTKREVYHVVVNFFFCLLLVGIFPMTNHFCRIMKREMKKVEPEIVVIRLQCGVVKTLLHEATFGIVLKWPSIFLVQYVKDDRFFSLQEDHKDYLVNLEAIQVDNIRGKLYAGHSSFSGVRNQAYMHSSRQGKCLHFCRQLP